MKLTRTYSFEPNSKIKHLYLVCLFSLMAACDPIPEIEPGEKSAEPESYGELIGTFFVENRNMTLRLYDITDLYNEVCYVSWPVPVNHTRYDNLPNELKETVKNYGLATGTQVYKLKWKGETVYHLICTAMDDYTGVYKPSGERITFNTIQEYYQFLQEVTDVSCLLLINTEVVKSAEGAPNLLVGTWQMDWEHLHHDISPNSSGIDDQVALYENLPFSITEVCHFEANGTGYELLGRKIYQSFAYTVEGNDDALQLTLYKYDTGFYSSDGFWKEGDWTYSYASQPTPKGKVMKAKIYDSGNSLELEGFFDWAADMSQKPNVFQRVHRKR